MLGELACVDRRGVIERPIGVVSEADREALVIELGEMMRVGELRDRIPNRVRADIERGDPEWKSGNGQALYGLFERGDLVLQGSV